MTISRIYTDIKASIGNRTGRLARNRAEKARRDFNVWAWEQNRCGRQARLGA